MLTNCKLHCGVRAVRCLRSFLDRHVLSDTDALRNPQRQLTSDRCGFLVNYVRGYKLFND